MLSGSKIFFLNVCLWNFIWKAEFMNQLNHFRSQLAATRQKSSCSLATSKGESRDSGSALSLLSAAVERLGLEAWRRTEPEEMELGT